MNYNRIWNFSAGPAVMPVPVLEEIRDEVLNWNGTGMSVMEMSHRSETFRSIVRDAERGLRELMNIPDDYAVLFIQGGGTLQFSMVPINLMRRGKAVYIDTGLWSGKAADEARKFGAVVIGASGREQGYTAIPDCAGLAPDADTDYVYICENETVNGLTWQTLPATGGCPLVADQSSMFLSQPCDVRNYGMIFAGVQKNVGPAGMVIAIIRRDLIRADVPAATPVYLRYATHADAQSGYNTPNGWSIYCCGKVIRHLIRTGGLQAAHERNAAKARLLYDFLDGSKLFRPKITGPDRSVMNIPFVTADPALDEQVLAAAAKAGITGLKGHPAVGSLRASLYNAMPLEGVQALVRFLEDFEKDHPHHGN